MDPRSVVAGAASAAETVFAEQAVFTSTRSPLGRGYRIVAASAGIRPDEKREIVQRAPSHHSLCATSAHGRGLACFNMQSGRRCVLLAQNAGMEHSGRGDYRVHTHVLVLEPPAYRGLRCDPLAAAAAAQAALADAWLDETPPAVLPRLALETCAAAGSAGRRILPCADEVDGLLAILSCLLQSRPVLVYGAHEPVDALGWVWSGLPLALREGASLSCGLRPAPGRSFALILSATQRDERQRCGLDGDYRLLEWPVTERWQVPQFEPWLSFVRQCWLDGQRDALDQLSTVLTRQTTALELAGVVSVCEDLARLAQAEPVPSVEEREVSPSTPAEAG